MKCVKNGIGWMLETLSRDPHDIHIISHGCPSFSCSHPQACSCKYEIKGVLSQPTLLDLVALQLSDNGFYPTLYKSVDYDSSLMSKLEVYEDRLARFSHSHYRIQFRLNALSFPFLIEDSAEKDIIYVVKMARASHLILPSILKMGSSSDPFIIDQMVEMTHQFFKDKSNNNAATIIPDNLWV